MITNLKNKYKKKLVGVPLDAKTTQQFRFIPVSSSLTVSIYNLISNPTQDRTLR